MRFNTRFYRELLVATIVATGLMMSCTENDNGPTTPAQPIAVTLTLASHIDTVVVGAVNQLSIGSFTVTPAGTSTGITWASANVAVVTVSQNGTVTGIAPGTAYVIATSVAKPSVKDSARFTVLPVVLATLVVSPHSSSVMAGGQVMLTANLQVTTGLSTSITWSSSNTVLATVSSSGTVSTTAAGSVLITATSVAVPSVKDTSRITILSIPQVRSITAPFGYDTLRVGQMQNLKLFTVVADGGVVTTYHCATTNGSIATIDPVTCVLRAWKVTPVDSFGVMLPIQVIAETDGVNQAKGRLAASINLFIKP